MSSTVAARPSVAFFVRLEPRLKQRIQRFAAERGRPETQIAAEALRAFLDANEEARPPKRGIR
jgi:predicted transcriptional regulator